MKIKIVSWNVDNNFDTKTLSELPVEIDVPISKIGGMTTNEDIHDCINDTIGVFAYEYEIKPTKDNAKELWEILSDVIVDDNDEIESDWFIFEAGTPKEYIWKWFEDYFHISVAEDLL